MSQREVLTNGSAFKRTDGRWGGVRESLEAQTMGMAKAAQALIEGSLRYPDGSPAMLPNGLPLLACPRPASFPDASLLRDPQGFVPLFPPQVAIGHDGAPVRLADGVPFVTYLAPACNPDGSPAFNPDGSPVYEQPVAQPAPKPAPKLSPCPNCGKPVALGVDNFCSGCGQKL